MSQQTRDDDIAEAFRLLASRSPRPPGDALAQIAHRSRARRRMQVVGGGVVVAAVAAITAVIGSGIAHSSPRTLQPAESGEWHELYGPELADALGLQPVPLADVDETPACDGKYVVAFEADMTYCFAPADFGVADPVEADMLMYQLQGIPPSPKLAELAELEVEVRGLANREPPSDGDAQAIIALMRQIEQLKNDVLPQNW
jgi:hypothetical protein